MLRVCDEIAIEEWELTEQFVRASGPGGQNVNKVSTAVELRFAAATSPSLTPAIKARLRRLAGRRWVSTGEVVITSDRYRSQPMNREDARKKLAELIQAATVAPRRRIATRPTRASKERRIHAKKQRGEVKSLRKPPET